MSALEFREADMARMIAVLPVAAVEQHGPHLPVGVDTQIMRGYLDRVVERLPQDLPCLFLPIQQIGASLEHTGFPGTLSLPAEVAIRAWTAIGESVARAGCRKLVILNAHGGNSALLNVANRELRLHHGLMTFLTHPGVPADQGGTSPAGELGMGVHGGTDETSMMLHLAPHLVDMSKAERRVPEGMADNRYVRFGGRVSFGWLSNDFFPDGYIGDPTPATAELGRTLFDGSVQAFCEALAEIAVFDYGRPA